MRLGHMAQKGILLPGIPPRGICLLPEMPFSYPKLILQPVYSLQFSRLPIASVSQNR